MIKVGLTGGIGSGKSASCEIFSTFGTPVIDADQIVRQLTAVGSPYLKTIASTFGHHLLDDGGALKRAELREIVFADVAKRKRLEAMLHPAVAQKISAETAVLHAPYCVICIPLLIESNMFHLVDLVVVLDCPQVLQIERVRKRDGWSPLTTLKTITAQALREQRLSAADIVVNNSGDKHELERQIASLHRHLTQRANAKKA